MDRVTYPPGKLLSLLLALALLCVPFRAARAEEATLTDLPPEEEPRTAPAAGAELEVWFPTIQDADCTLILCGGKAVMIDCGTREDYGTIRDLMRRAGVKRLDLMIVTHPHHDHLGSLRSMLRKGLIKEIVAFHRRGDGDKTSLLWHDPETYGVPVHLRKSGDTIVVGSIVLEAYVASKPMKDMNARSAVLKLTYGESTMLFLSDIDPPTMLRLLRARGAAWLKADVLRAAHHGKRAMPDRFAQAVDPDYIVITAHKSAVEGKLQAAQLRAKVLYTTRKTIRMTTDGFRWKVQRLE